MAIRGSGKAMGEIQALFRLGAMGSWPDSQLVTQFLAGQDGSEAAFRILIHRHGPMVLGVCRRILGDEHAAEDAFQATFLVLVKKAGTLRDCELLTNWLYGVALRVASRERARGARRRVVERRAAESSISPEGESDQGELRSVIDEEIRRLPERYRLPILLCHVEGLRHEEVAQRLGCPVGTVESRLSRARQQLRARLERRGLAPSAPALGILLQPPKTDLLPSLVEATVKAAVEPATGLTSTALQQVALLVTGLCTRVGAVATALAVVTCVAAIGLGAFRVDGETPRRDATPPAPSREPTGSIPRQSPQERPRETAGASVREAAGSIPLRELARDDSIRPRRSMSAVARPLSGITIDGRLDDWPKDLQSYPIERLYPDRRDSDPGSEQPSRDTAAHFQVGYDRQAGLIYLAVVVRDSELVVPSARGKKIENNLYKTDAVEVYVDGAFSDRKIPEPSGNWLEDLDAATMPVLQYVGVPGEVAAYGDKWGANPSLVYARTEERRTRMKYRRQGDITTYEWAIQAYDEFPDRPTELVAGKRIGLDVVVVDKDSEKGLSAWMYWGPKYTRFKGCDASNLGELILAEGR